MHLDTVFVSRELVGRDLRGRSALVIDVLRATTTIITALGAGAAAVYPVADVEGAFRLAQQLGGAVLGGERGGLPLPGFHAGNSPAEYREALVKGRPVVLTTTNGTLAVHRALAAGAEALAVAALVNARAAAAWAVRQGRDLTVVCAGTEEKFTLEDAVAAGCIVARCLELDPQVQLTDAARAAFVLWESYRHDPHKACAESWHGRRLAGLGFADDLRRCAEVDASSVVPVWRGDRLCRTDV